MKHARARRLTLLLTTSGAILAWTACNLGADLQDCASDADCPSHQSCNLSVGLCISNGGSDAAPDVRDATVDHVDGADASIDATPIVTCDLTQPFANPTLLPGFENQEIFSARPTQNGLTLYYAAYNPVTLSDLWEATRTSLDASFGMNGDIPGAVNSSADEFWPTLSPDGTLIYFESARFVDGTTPGDDKSRIWTAALVDPGQPLGGFGDPYIQPIFEIDSGYESAPYLHPLLQNLYFVSNARPGAGDFDIFVATINPKNGVVLAVTNIAAINTAVEENFPVVTDDQQSLYFSRPNPNGVGEDRDILVAKASTSVDGGWGTPVGVAELNDDYDEFPSYPTADGCTLYFISNRPKPTDPEDSGAGLYHVWTASRPPLAKE